MKIIEITDKEKTAIILGADNINQAFIEINIDAQILADYKALRHLLTSLLATKQEVNSQAWLALAKAVNKRVNHIVVKMDTMITKITKAQSGTADQDLAIKVQRLRAYRKNIIGLWDKVIK